MARGSKRRDRAARSRFQRFLGIGRRSTADQFGKPLWVEQLEDRRMLATFTVTNLQDLVFNNEGELVVAGGSLRAAIIASNETEEGDAIFFSPSLSGSIFLGRAGDEFGQLTIEGSVNIVGTGTRKIEIIGTGDRRVFEIAGEGDDIPSVQISGLTISGGAAFGTDEDAGKGGGILNNGNLTLTEVDLRDNSATEGGGIYNLRSLNVQRSLIRDNTAFSHGGGIQNGATPGDDGGGTGDGPAPSTTIQNSTISGNEAATFGGYGGGLFNANGRVTINHCTIVNNVAYLGSGVASWGNPPDEEGGEGEDPEPVPPTNFTTIEGSILFRNTNHNDEGNPLLGAAEIDIDNVGKGEDTGEEEPAELKPSININNAGEPGKRGGNNLLFGLGANVEPSAGDVPAGTDPNFYDTDVMIGDVEINIPVIGDYGGATDVFHPDIEELEGNPIINHHNDSVGSNDQRGIHFVRVFEEGAEDPKVDLGAVEVQKGSFIVDIIADESDDLQYTAATGITTRGDFSIREALNFSRKNPLVDTITFNLGGQVDPTPSPAPTLLLTNPAGPLVVNHAVNIVGPSSFILEIDANDPSPVFGNGKRIFTITNNNDTEAVDVSISNLTLIRGDANGSGGAILNRENLTLTNMTLHNNRASLDGGAIHHDLGTLNVVSSTISGSNSSDDGAIYIAQNSGAVVLSNATISGNTAGDRGAGIFNRGTDTRVEFSTITNNNAGSTLGSGVMSWAGEITFYSTIIAGNFLNDFTSNAATTPTNVSEGYNLYGVVTAVQGFPNPFGAEGDIQPVNNNPMLAPLAYAGGITQTHALLVGSPAIDVGDETPTNAPTYDQRGNPFVRSAAGSDEPGAPVRMDIGAYELQGVVFLVDAGGDVDNGNYGVGDLTLREAIKLANLSSRTDVIEFDVTSMSSPFLNNPSINPNGTLTISDDVVIQWLGFTPLTLGGTGTVFNINDGNANNEIAVSIRGGDRGVSQLVFSGRNIVNSEDLTLEVVDMLGNSTSAITHTIGTLTIHDSTLTGNISSVSGGAINAQNAAGVFIYESTLTGNSTAFTGGHGGAVYLKNVDDFYGEDVVLANNLTAAGASDGAGMYVEGGDVEFVRSVISGNSTTGANSDGAGIFAKNANIVLHEGTTLALNTTFGTSSRGGAIYLNGNGTLEISESVTMTFNRTVGQFSHGGAIANFGGTVTISKTELTNNTTSGADAHGGAIYVQNGSLSVIESTLAENSTNGLRSDGGAIFSNTSLTGLKTEIINSTISGNSAQDRGGGIYNADGLTVIKYSTITNNSAPYFGFGAGVGSFGTMSTTRTEIGSSIIAGNKVHDPMEVNGVPTNLPSDVDRINGSFQDSFMSLGYNLIGAGITSQFTSATNDYFNITDSDQIGLDDELLNNGGPTRTYALRDGSLAINRGNPNAAEAPSTDQRGEARVQKGRMDIGAYESDISTALPGDYNGDGVVNGRDFLAWQRGQSPTPGSSSDLTDWQSNYGTGGSVATVVTTEDVAGPAFAPLMVEDAEPAVPTVVAESVPAATGSPVLVGWIPSYQSTAEASAADADVEESGIDAAYLAVFADGLGDFTIADSASDFGDIATCRSADDDADTSAEDTVFELIGAGEL